MTEKEDAISIAPSLLDVVALLIDLPVDGLARGQVGTIVDLLDEETVLSSSAMCKGAHTRSRLVLTRSF